MKIKKTTITIQTTDEIREKVFNLVRNNPNYVHNTVSSFINIILMDELLKIEEEENNK